MTKDDTAKVEKNSGGKFTKGTPKPENSGRKKGTPNKRTKEFLDALGDFPTVENMKTLYYTTEDDNLKFMILKELAKYQYPQRKAVEMTADVDMPIISIKGL